jgi:hypothetical protein
MDPLTATWITGIAINFATEIIVSGFKSFQDTGVDHDLELAYSKALEKWTQNTQIRHIHEHLSRPKLEQVLNSFNGLELNFDVETKRFIEIFKIEICNKKYLSLYQHVNLELQKKQIDLLYEIRNNQNLSNGSIPELKIFPKPLGYIDRTVSGYSNSDQLVEIVKNEHAVALIGEGGLGKTTELDCVASMLSNEGWYCGLVRLINYASSLETLIESQFANWRNIPISSKVLILLDGLDEVSSSNISTVENEIIGLARTHKNVHFLISYRNSYSLFLSLNNKKGESDEMVRVTLDPISIEFVTKYIQDNADKPSDVIGQFQRQNLFEICKNPFYLVNYIEIINETGNVPDNKSDFFEKILLLRFNSEQKKGSEIRREVRNRDGNLRKKLGELALTMQLAGKYQIENCDIQEIIDDPDLLETSRRIVLYEPGITDLENWRFEHNNFQEYLAAKKLSKCSWEQMQSLLFLPNKKLKPKWNNTISFLINQLDQKREQHQQLVEWLIENDQVAFVKLDVVHLDQVIRNQVFYSIYNFYRKKEIVFHAEFSADDLARFCDLENNPELIEFLLSELKPEMVIQNLRNIVELFLSIKPTHFIERIATALSRYLVKEEYAKYSIHASILEIYTNWNWNNDPVLKSTVADDLLIQDGTTRSKLIDYHLAVQSPYISADFILRCFKNQKNDLVHTFYIYAVTEIISQLPVLEIKHLLDGLIILNENNQISDGDFIDVIQAIEKRATILYSGHNEILPIVNKFVLTTLEHVYPPNQAWAIKPFYEKNNLVLSLFSESFSSEQKRIDQTGYSKFEFSGYLANEECIRWIINEYQQNKISENDIRYLSSSMGYYRNGIGYQLLTEKMNAITNGTFFPNTPDIYTDIYNKTEELYAKAILSKEMYIEYIEKAFDYFGKDELTKKDFWNKEDRKNYLYDVDFHICHRCLNAFMDNDTIVSKQEVINYIYDDQNWSALQLHEHYKLSRHCKLQLDNIEWISNWCKEHELKIDFENALTDNENGGIPNTYWAVCYIQFCLGTGYYSEHTSVLKDLVWCLSQIEIGPSPDGGTIKNFKLYDYLKIYLPNEEINEQIVKNLESGAVAKDVLQEYRSIVDKEKIVKAAAFLPPYILNEKLDKWTRYKTLEVFFELGGRFEDVQKLIDSLHYNQDESADWYIIDELIQQNKSLPAQHLIGLIENEQINQYKLALRLIKCGKTEGLDILCSILKEKNSNANYKEFRQNDFEQFVTSGDFAVEDVVPRLENLLLIHLQPEFELDEWSNLIGQLFNLLAYYFPYDKDGSIVKALGRIEEELSSSKNTVIYQIIYRNFQKTKLDLNIQEDKETDIGEAIEKLKRIGVCH